MQQYEVNEIIEAFLAVFGDASEHEINMFTPKVSISEAKAMIDLIPKAQQYLADNPAKKPMALKRR